MYGLKREPMEKLVPVKFGSIHWILRMKWPDEPCGFELVVPSIEFGSELVADDSPTTHSP